MAKAKGLSSYTPKRNPKQVCFSLSNNHRSAKNMPAPPYGAGPTISDGISPFFVNKISQLLFKEITVTIPIKNAENQICIRLLTSSLSLERLIMVIKAASMITQQVRTIADQVMPGFVWRKQWISSSTATVYAAISPRISAAQDRIEACIWRTLTV